MQHNKTVNGTLDQFKNENLLCKKTAEGLKVINPKTAKSYITPTIHKENNLGRSVINSVNCNTSEVETVFYYQVVYYLNQHIITYSFEVFAVFYLFLLHVVELSLLTWL